ncbi:DUF4124 domain-containing protein [Hydrogenophaga sp.]|uniref:DUF4124 domain-containing protein n=1 Tax=Hydrogenophaga sp. TaxID=1904254 RepID=UPI00271F2409|nr:DUF4124 domain-containing protein [Hydrogenophaga sp.]MDO8903976.1 DUF4124 domain-containing protein [Hydrogenophaga sp.]
MLKIAFSMLLAVAASQAVAVNKCTGPDGKVTFQDAPCAGKGGAIEVRPASGSTTVQPATAKAEVERINASVAASAQARRVIELDALLIPRARGALTQHLSDCARKRRDLEASQYAYLQNLYGKTHAAQKAAEIVQLSLDCERGERSLGYQLGELQAERDRLARAEPAPQN